MQVTAHLRRLRMSPRKVRLVADVVRGMDIDEADAQLAHLAKAAARPMRKLIASAVANAKHNFDLNESNLFIERVSVDQGPTLKRYRPRAFGRATTIRKRTSHITLILGERVPGMSNNKSNAGIKKRVQSTAAPIIATDRAAAVKKEAVSDGSADGRARNIKSWQKNDEKGGSSTRRGFFRQFMNRRSGEK